MKKLELPLQIFLLVALVSYSQFYKLNSFAYRMWDEAHLANNAYEMSKSGNLIVTTIGYNPDLDCTKPPLMIWAQALCIKLHGLSELSTRLPSTLCAVLTILLAFSFVLYITKNGWAALASAIVLCTAKGYIGTHATRFGEYDSMLTLFTTLSLISFYFYTELSGKAKNRFLILFFIALTLGLLTKGIVILLFGPVLLLYLVIRKQLKTTLTNRNFYAGLGIFLVFGVGYYFLRECLNPGYLRAVYDNELGGRFLEVNQGHAGAFDLYFNHLKADDGFGTWYWALPTALLLLPFNLDKIHRRLVFFLFLCASGFILILSMSATKIFWYDLPLYPLFAIIIAILTLQLADLVFIVVPFITQKSALLIIIVIISIQPVYEMTSFIRRCDCSDGNFYNISYYLRNKIRTGSRNLKDTFYYDQGYMALASDLYVYELNEKGMNIKRINMGDIENLKPGNKVICNYEKADSVIEAKYNYKVVEESGNTRLYLIEGQKSNS